MGYDRAKIAGTREAADIVAKAGFEADFQDDRSGIKIEVRDEAGRSYLFLDGFWDAQGLAADDTLMSFVATVGEWDYREVGAARPAVDFTDGPAVAAAILAILADVD